MKKLIIFIFSIFILSGNSFAYVSFVGTDDDTSERKYGKLLLRQSWFSQRLELNEKYSKSTYLVNKGQYIEAINNIDSKIIEKVGNYTVYFSDKQLKNYKKIMALSFQDSTAVVFATNKKLSEKQVKGMAVHEFGHNVAFNLMDEELWKEYKEIRGISDEKKYSNSSKLEYNRPQEIFAEDFRILFGDELASSERHINNYLNAPEATIGLVDFFNKLFI